MLLLLLSTILKIKMLLLQAQLVFQKLTTIQSNALFLPTSANCTEFLVLSPLQGGRVYECIMGKCRKHLTM
ncbi:unnamed protein product [Brassica rapa subsp. narinosa]